MCCQSAVRRHAIATLQASVDDCTVDERDQQRITNANAVLRETRKDSYWNRHADLKPVPTSNDRGRENCIKDKSAVHLYVDRRPFYSVRSPQQFKEIEMSFLDVGGRSWAELANDASVIHMGHNCNHLPIEPSINRAMIDAIASESYRNYPPPYGIDELRELIRVDLAMPDAGVLITNGSTEAIYQALSVVLGPNDEIIVSDPAWPHIGNFARTLGARVVQMPIYSEEAQFKLKAERIRACLSHKTRVIAIIDPLNPLGSTYSEQEIREICAIAATRGIYVLHDCTYRHFAGPPHYPALRCYDRAIVTVSLSKACGFAGLRTGAAVVSTELFEDLVANHISRLGVNLVTQIGAAAAYRTKDRWLPGMISINHQHQRMLADCIGGMEGFKTLVFPSAGNFIAVDVTGAGLTAENVVRRTLQRGFVIRSGGYTSERFGDAFVRITMTVPTQDIRKFCETFPLVLTERVAA
jgi:aspartate aminotransferase